MLVWMKPGIAAAERNAPHMKSLPSLIFIAPVERFSLCLKPGRDRSVRMQVNIESLVVIAIPCPQSHDCKDSKGKHKLFDIIPSYRDKALAFLLTWLYCFSVSIFRSSHLPRATIKDLNCSTDSA